MQLIRICCVCNKTEDKGVWDNHAHHTEADKKKRGTHGFCLPCYHEQMHKLYKGKYLDHRYDI